MVRLPLLVKACPGVDVSEHALLTLQRPLGTILVQARRDGVELVPALQATMRIDHRFEQFVHRWPPGLVVSADRQVAVSSCLTSSGVSSIKAAARFSSRCATVEGRGL